MSAAKSNVINTSGKRKRAIARATLKPGKGMIRVNGQRIEIFKPALARMKILEPMILVGDLANKVDVQINLNGGGQSSGPEAARLALARALVAFGGNDIKEKFMAYDRFLLVADVRRKERYKPNDSKARAKRQKSYR
ncbi:30S ribosomal protein S9 [Nanoarchaeota archaeon]